MNINGKDHARILVADDTMTNQEILKRTFESEGFSVIQAMNGVEAVEMIDRERPDLIMLDIMMPKMDGMEVLKKIKVLDPDILVVMMTAHGSENIAVEAMKLGANDYLTKPFHPRDVTLLAKKLIRERSIRIENQRLKEKIEKAERYLAHLVGSVNEAIISTDQNGRIISFNRAAEKLWGMKESDAIGRGIEGMFYVGKTSRHLDNIIIETRSSGHFDGEFLFLRVDGSTFPGHLNTSTVKDEGSDAGIVALVRDLTEEKRLQSRLIESQKLASLGKVVEGVAHEVRNPLMSIGGFARRIDSQMGEDNRYGKYLKAIISDVERLERMVNDIEEYARFSKLHKLAYKSLSIPDILKHLLEGLEDKLSSSKVTSSVEFIETTPTVYADETYIRELFSNIIVNAIEAMPKGGKLDIKVRTEGNYLVTEVIDTGIGIPKEKLGEIFDPFYTSKMSGAGLGLTKCHMIATEHQGYIAVDSTPEKGSIFAVGIPVERRHRMHNASPQQEIT